MQRILILILVFVCASADAQVFRRVGPDGQVYFSDRPGPDAEPVDVTPAQSISLPAVPEQTDSAGQAAEVAPAYTVFTIISPVSEQAVRANDGNVTVHLLLQPGLRSGHRIVLEIDGEDGRDTSVGEDMSIELDNLSRGLHTIEAVVIDEAGNELIRSEPVSFNVLRVARGG